jgi:hypothetical protein
MVCVVEFFTCTVHRCVDTPPLFAGTSHILILPPFTDVVAGRKGGVNKNDKAGAAVPS